MLTEDLSLPIINYSYTNQEMLYQAYMPYLQNNGLFIRTDEIYKMGTKVLLQINLFNETERFTIPGKVAWITPVEAQANRPAGIGVQFLGEQAPHLCNKIEILLADMIISNHITDTM